MAPTSANGSGHRPENAFVLPPLLLCPLKYASSTVTVQERLQPLNEYGIVEPVTT